jgi:hypothetical protein
MGCLEVVEWTTAMEAQGRDVKSDFLFELTEQESRDPQLVGDYASDVMNRMRDDEGRFQPRSNYMETQTDINGRMRAILVDWLVEVHMKYKMRWETLFLAISVVDRYLSVRHISRKNLQLLGVVAMFIAAKYEEIDPPKAQEFAYITDHTYSKKEIILMEIHVLTALNFKISAPTPAHFVDRWHQANGSDPVQKALVQYILEVSLLDLRSLQFAPSALAGASILLSNETLRRRAPAALSQKAEMSLNPCVEDLRRMVDAVKQSNLQVVQRKYRLEQHFAVANLI